MNFKQGASFVKTNEVGDKARTKSELIKALKNVIYLTLEMLSLTSVIFDSDQEQNDLVNPHFREFINPG